MKEFLRRFAAWCGFFRCPLCEEKGGNGRNEICPECREQLELLPVKGRCRGCGGRIDSVLAVCSNCMAYPERPYCDALAVMEYSGAGRTLIRQMKFGNRPELARPLAMLAAEKLRESGMEFDVIVPVPIHWRRFLERSYNQTELLGRRGWERDGREARSPPRRVPVAVKHVFAVCFAGFDNDPSAGSPTETLLRLLLPLNDKVQWTSRDVAGGEPPTSPRSEHFTGPFNR